jgi:hypothetical protein
VLFRQAVKNLQTYTPFMNLIKLSSQDQRKTDVIGSFRVYGYSCVGGRVLIDVKLKMLRYYPNGRSKMALPEL